MSKGGWKRRAGNRSWSDGNREGMLTAPGRGVKMKASGRRQGEERRQNGGERGMESERGVRETGNYTLKWKRMDRPVSNTGF